MQKSRALQTHIDKCRLHTGQNPGHPTQINIANQAPRRMALDMEFLDNPLFEDGDPSLLGREIYEDTFGHR